MQNNRKNLIATLAIVIGALCSPAMIHAQDTTSMHKSSMKKDTSMHKMHKMNKTKMSKDSTKTTPPSKM